LKKRQASGWGRSILSSEFRGLKPSEISGH
jgi:hypothetical protein